MNEFKDYNLKYDQLINRIKQCITATTTMDCNVCKDCPLHGDTRCGDILLYNALLMLESQSLRLEHNDKRVLELSAELEKMEEKLEERCNNCDLIPDQDPQNYDLMQIVDEIVDACNDLVVNKRILPSTLMRYIEDVIHDRERRRVWNSDTEEME